MEVKGSFNNENNEIVWNDFLKYSYSVGMQ